MSDQDWLEGFGKGMGFSRAVNEKKFSLASAAEANKS